MPAGLAGPRRCQGRAGPQTRWLHGCSVAIRGGGQRAGGLAETLTVTRLGVPDKLAKTLRTTNPVESMLSVCRQHSSNVKRWRDGQMAMRWCAAGMLEAEGQFRRVKGYREIPVLIAAMDRHFHPEMLAGKEEVA